MARYRAPSIKVYPALTSHRKATVTYPASPKRDAIVHFTEEQVELEVARTTGGQPMLWVTAQFNPAKPHPTPDVLLRCTERMAIESQVSISLVVELESDLGPKGHFSDERDVKFALTATDFNPWPWCMVKVRVEWLGFTGESGWMGACSYLSEDDYKAGGYYADQVGEAINDWKAKIAKMKEAVDAIKVS